MMEIFHEAKLGFQRGMSGPTAAAMDVFSILFRADSLKPTVLQGRLL
jgi:hypothetical protein